MSKRLPRWRAIAERIRALDRSLRHFRRDGGSRTRQRQSSASGAAPAIGPTSSDCVAPFLTWVPPGHFYSPDPNLDEIRHQAERIYERSDHLDGLDLDEDAQLDLFRSLAPLANEASFTADPAPDSRYCTSNPSYGVGDAVITQAFLRHLRPNRYLEVGSGWTTPLALDINERWLDNSMRVTCIEPHWDDLKVAQV